MDCLISVTVTSPKGLGGQGANLSEGDGNPSKPLHAAADVYRVQSTASPIHQLLHFTHVLVQALFARVFAADVSMMKDVLLGVPVNVRLFLPQFHISCVQMSGHQTWKTTDTWRTLRW
jgi:hypothetical protein